jgi:hypothetical protein
MKGAAEDERVVRDVHLVVLVKCEGQVLQCFAVFDRRDGPLDYVRGGMRVHADGITHRVRAVERSNLDDISSRHAVEPCVLLYPSFKLDVSEDSATFSILNKCAHVSGIKLRDAIVIAHLRAIISQAS